MFPKIIDWEVQISPMIGFAFGFIYSNEEIEQVEYDEDKRHTIQIVLLFFIININYFTDEKNR